MPATSASPQNESPAASSVHWYVTRVRRPEGTRYAVYVDGRLITDGHLSGEQAVIEAVRALARQAAALPPEGETESGGSGSGSAGGPAAGSEPAG